MLEKQRKFTLIYINLRIFNATIKYSKWENIIKSFKKITAREGKQNSLSSRAYIVVNCKKKEIQNQLTIKI